MTGQLGGESIARIAKTDGRTEGRTAGQMDRWQDKQTHYAPGGQLGGPVALSSPAGAQFNFLPSLHYVLRLLCYYFSLTHSHSLSLSLSLCIFLQFRRQSQPQVHLPYSRPRPHSRAAPTAVKEPKPEPKQNGGVHCETDGWQPIKCR